MKIEDFYKAIKKKDEPNDFNEIKHLIDPVVYDKPGNKLIYHGTHYHLFNYSKYVNEGIKANFNFAAFFLNIYWFLYRRMYPFALALLPLHFFVKWANSSSEIIAIIIGLGTNLFLGLYGNSLYYWNVKRRFKKGLSSRPEVILVWLYILIELTSLLITEFLKIAK